MASLWAQGVTDLEVRVDRPELPGLDGSAALYFEAIDAVGTIELGANRRYLPVRVPIEVSRGDATIVALPLDCGGLKVSYTLDYSSAGWGTQYFSGIVDRETFGREIAPARTFCLEDEAEALRDAGLGLGATTENTLVLGRDGRVLENEFRFPDELVRHKVLDLIGDLYLAGGFLEGHILATKSGHRMNVALARRIAAKLSGPGGPGAGLPKSRVLDRGRTLSIHEITRSLPHSFPFLFVDRVVAIADDGRSARGLKNVTVNEEYFSGHFPGNPVMPGVLQLEGMAQLAGLMLLSHDENVGKLAYLLSVDGVKFRRPVVPGDQMVYEAVLVAMKPRTARVDVRTTVDGQLTAEAHIRFMLVAGD
jgi:UDP-3-O-[3-hydroxymyristoyl] N-acetylglucosamine deacetylase/3-hydroxyacyl-[acyl-carrier-protein] dehydratase